MAVGAIARCPIPRPIRGFMFRAFSRLVGITLDECELPLDSYSSLSSFFSRGLRPGLRPLGVGVVSPADGMLRSISRITDGTLLQAKGRTYSVSALLQDETRARQFLGGTALTVYLSPRDYHRVHSPVGGALSAIHVIPGALWPVNAWAVASVPMLFCQNERMIFYVAAPFGQVAVVMVGATNVGAISSPFSTHVTNRSLRHAVGLPTEAPGTLQFDRPPRIGLGEILGTFHLGSTVIVLLPPLPAVAMKVTDDTVVRMGMTLLQIVDGAPGADEAGSSATGECRS